jgi:hypothetical protein
MINSYSASIVVGLASFWDSSVLLGFKCPQVLMSFWDSSVPGGGGHLEPVMAAETWGPVTLLSNESALFGL